MNALLPFLDAARTDALLEDRALIERLRSAFRSGLTAPPRHHHRVPTGAQEATLLLMPAWRAGEHLGVKVVTVFPDNTRRGMPSVQGLFLLLDGRSGAPLALIDGPTLTRRRTAAASALAASYLARQDARHLLMVGAGTLAAPLIRAHAAVRPLRRVTLWNRTPERALALARALRESPFTVTVAEDLAEAARRADVISCATLSHEPLVHGVWLRPGTHLDLVGGYTPAMREADDEAVARATCFVDTREGALREAGDIIQPLRAGVLTEEDLAADLYALCDGRHPGRQHPDEITLFKSVGHAVEDLVAAELAYEAWRNS